MSLFTEQSLTQVERASWQQLAAALAPDSKSPSPDAAFRTMTLATCTPNGADARTVILRQVDANRKYVWFHTDARSAKVIELESQPSAALLFWNAERQVQLRMLIETRLHTDDYVADEQWSRLWVGSRKMYLSEHTPASVLPAPYPGFPASLGDGLPSAGESEAGRPNFAVIECRVLSMEYLHLSRSGHTRARFQYEPIENFVWLAP